MVGREGSSVYGGRSSGFPGALNTHHTFVSFGHTTPLPSKPPSETDSQAQDDGNEAIECVQTSVILQLSHLQEKQDIENQILKEDLKLQGQRGARRAPSPAASPQAEWEMQVEWMEGQRSEPVRRVARQGSAGRP